MRNENFHNWSITKGDYKRDETTTWSYQKKLLRRKKIKNTLSVLVYLIIVTVLAYLIFS